MTDLINVPVPAPLADEVRRFVAFLISDRRLGDDTPVGPIDTIPDYPMWSDEDVIALAGARTVTAGIYRRIMDAVVQHEAAARWVSIAELAEWTGQSKSVISTFRTHLYRYINSRMPAGTMAPFTRANGQDLRPARGRDVYYRVSAECAQQWQRVRAQLEVA